MKFDRFVANRYLHAKRKQAFIGVISLITLVGITLGVAALNIALSVHNGMREAFMTSLIGEVVSERPSCGIDYSSVPTRPPGLCLRTGACHS